MKNAIKQLRDNLAKYGQEVHSQSWQGDKPLDVMVELLHISKIIPMMENPDKVAEATNARMPWAYEHFQERVSGIPFNPPPSASYWAGKDENVAKHYAKGHKCFSHSYPERMWSKGLHSGIRYDIADLNTLVEVIKKDPTTRQAYLPLYFPEDLTAALEGERVPCTLGWQFIIRNEQMDVFYPIRSCDAMRHMHHDLYFANMLALWIREQAGLKVKMGQLHFVATSLHCFKSDIELYKKGFIK